MEPEIPTPDGPLTRSLHNWREANPQDAGRVIEAAYAELRIMASRLLNSEPKGGTLQPTALVHELYLRLGAGRPPEWKNRAHFFAIAASTLRRILIDRARANLASRRGGGQVEEVCNFPDSFQRYTAEMVLNQVQGRKCGRLLGWIMMKVIQDLLPEFIRQNAHRSNSAAMIFKLPSTATTSLMVWPTINKGKMAK